MSPSVSARRADRRARAVRSSPGAGVTGGGEEAVERHLDGDGVRGRQRPPPPPRTEAHRGLDRAFAVAAPRRAGFDHGPVVLGHRREAGLDVAGPRHDHRGQAVGAPDLRRAPEATHHLVHGFDQMGLVERLGQHAADAPRVGQRAEKHIRGAAPGRVSPFEPVPLDLLAGGMVDLDGVSALHPPTRLAVGAQPAGPDLADEARIAECVAERDDLVIEGAGPHVAVLREPQPEIVLDPGQRVGRRAAADSRLALTAQIAPDGLAVVTQVSGDGRDRPAPLPQCMCFHVFPLCEHDGRVPSSWLA
jgi:hypothetical protein